MLLTYSRKVCGGVGAGEYVYGRPHMWLPFYFGGRASRGYTALCPLIDLFDRSYFTVPTRVAWRGWCECPSPGSPIDMLKADRFYLVNLIPQLLSRRRHFMQD